MKRLTLKIIESYEFPKTITRPDWDDVQNNYTLPNGIELSTLTICNNQPCKSDCLEGWDGFIYIETKEELDELINSSLDDIIDKLESENENFDRENFE